MARISIIIVLCCFIQNIFSQEYSYGFRVEFTDKDNSSFSVNNPETFLSQRAINRRIKYNIAITQEDLPVNKSYADSIAKHGAVLHNTSKWFNSAVYLTNNSLFAEDVASVSFVEKVTLVFGNSFKNGSERTKIDKFSKLSENDELDYGMAYNQINMCKGQTLHNLGKLGQGMHIAVLDAGFWRVNEINCFNHLFSENRILGTYDFVKNEHNVYEDHYHGEAVLSILAANIPNQMLGTAPEASYWLLRTENANSEYPIEEEYWVRGAEFADSAGADLITTSLGYSVFDNASLNYSYASMDGQTTRITQGAEKAFTKGIFVVSSAGNEGNNSWNYLTAPSDGAHVLCVGAVDANEQIASFSSRGPSADGRVKPDAMGQGQSTVLVQANGDVSTGSGTSFSCPLMAGLVACLWQTFPQLSNQELLDIIRKVGDKNMFPDGDYGYGIPDFSLAYDLLKEVEIKDSAEAEIVDLNPNPFKNQLSFYLYLPTEQEVVIGVYDGLGKMVSSENRLIEKESASLINLSIAQNLQRGIYFLSITTNNETLIQKIIKQ